MKEAVKVATLYETSRESKILTIEDTDREETPFRLLVTLKKLGVVTMLDYFLSNEETEEIKTALSGVGSSKNPS